ncbi:MAG: NfeD family protein [Clostridia bacterium]|jgi:membrane protein implicated in regulation of membrane protease activity|nr:NfeD family protein [Clostridia bacterium]
MWQIWLIAAGVFFIVEMFTIGFFMFWFGIGCLLAMILSFFCSNIFIQFTVFFISSIILLLATKPLVSKLDTKHSTPTNVYSIIGKRGIVIEDINWVTGKGQIKSEGEIWSAKSSESINIPKNSEVEIESIEGVRVLVKPVK